MKTTTDLITLTLAALFVLTACGGPGRPGGGDVTDDSAGGCPANSTLVDDECISQQLVPCTPADVPEHGHQLDSDVTTVFTDANGWSTPPTCQWECDLDYDRINGECLNQRIVGCDDIEVPEDAHMVDEDVTITYTQADGWSTPPPCDWACDTDFDLAQGVCINQQTVPCADGEIPDHAQPFESDVTITFTSADGWSTPETCEWECVADYDLVDDACINEQTVPCVEMAMPVNAHAVAEDVTITFSDADGWSEPGECPWACDADFDLVDEACINEQTVPCADPALPGNAESVAVNVTITYSDADGWSTPAVCDWQCSADFDLVDEACINEQFAPCTPNDPPANAHQIVAAVAITYTDEKGWTDPDFCDWECNEDFDLDAEACINTQQVDCGDIAPPANAHQLEGQVTITYTDAEGWTEPEDCLWDCNNDFTNVDGACTNEQFVDCLDIVPPDNAHQVDAKVAIEYTDAQGWSDPLDCAWECNDDFDAVDDACVNEQLVDCAPIEPPSNAHQVDGLVTITYTTADGWTKPKDCKWDCNADFDLMAEACINQQQVACKDITPPINAHQVDVAVLITYTDNDGWQVPEDCGWDCNADHDLFEGACLDERFTACADIVPPANAHQQDEDVLITYTDADGWEAPAPCGWDCNVGYLTADDIACDICDNDLGYWAFGLDEDCSLSSWESQGTLYGKGDEVTMDEDGSGGAYLAWSLSTNGKPDIALQRLGPDGAPAPGWPAGGLVVCANEASQDNPSVIADDNGGAYVAWRDVRATQPAIFVQHVLADGTVAPGWPVDGLQVYPGDVAQEVRDPEMATDGAGGAIVTWWGYTGTKSSAFIMVRRVAPDASFPTGWESSVTLTTLSNHSSPHAVSDTQGGAYIAWTHSGCRVTRIAGDGNMAPGWGGMGIALAQPTGGLHCGLPIADGSGGVIVPWAASQGAVVGYDVFIQRLNSTGTTLWTDGNPIGGVKVSGGAFHENEPRAAPDGEGGAFVVWQDRRAGVDIFDGTRQEIFAGHILSNGLHDLTWPATWLQLSSYEDGFHSFPEIMPDGAGGAYALWERSDVGVGHEQLRLVRFAKTGVIEPGWELNGVTVAYDAQVGMHGHVMASDSEFGVLAGWVYEAFAGNEVKAVRVFSNAVLPLK